MPDFQYQLKYRDPLHAGPYGILVRDVAFHPKELGQHDYLAIPEIIEDICNGYEKYFGMRIHDIIKNALSPCIIKFKSPKLARAEEIGAALYYVYTYSNHLAVCFNSVMCYDGENTRVHPTQIVKIDFLD